MSTYSLQARLPHLPVPPLDDTLDKLLLSAEPLVSKAEFSTFAKAVEQFRNGLGPVLQQRLEQRSKDMAKKGKSFLVDWWRQLAYLSVRDPLVINISYFFHLGFPEYVEASQCLRAALLTRAAMEYRQELYEEKLKPDAIRGRPLCMAVHKYMFNTCRVPQLEEDVTNSYFDREHDYSHVVVLVNGKLFEIPTKDEKGRFLPVPTVVALLERIVSAEQRSLPDSAALSAGREIGKGYVETSPGCVRGVGILTSDNRDEWAKAHRLIVDGSQKNRHTLQRLQTAAFVVCLDSEKPATQDEQSRWLLHGSGGNRWWDKSIQFIVSANGEVGFIGEHSMMDGMHMAMMINQVMNRWVYNKEWIARVSRESSDSKPPVGQELPFVYSQALALKIESARQALESLASSHRTSTMHFTRYGTKTIKAVRCSPDAWMQIAFQLAYYRMYNRLVGTYEPAQMRRFATGRTECIRTASNAVKEFVKATAEGISAKNIDTLQHFLERALTGHSRETGECQSGKGIDRHLFGLNRLATKEEMASSAAAQEIFTGKTATFIQTWRISTSNLSLPSFKSWGWGEVVPDGYGIAYSTLPDRLQTHICSRTTMQPDLLNKEIENALRDMLSIRSFDKVLAKYQS